MPSVLQKNPFFSSAGVEFEVTMPKPRLYNKGNIMLHLKLQQGCIVLGVEMKTLSVNALNSEPVNSYREVLAKKMLAMLGAPPPRRDLELVDYSVNWLLNSAANSEYMESS